MRSFIFLCDLSTEQECLDRKLFGTNAGEGFQLHYRHIAVGDRLFLYNFELGLMRGPFTALTACINNLEPKAWKQTRRSFPWQVRVAAADSVVGTVRADDFAKIIPLTATKVGLLPPPELLDQQAAALISLLRASP